ncbi:hypothetical protein HMPREF1624_07976 [Sporothrix schenckii ATCC 58251]|uniref:DUF7136 domain-containing protein n=1 Tax=Sporothrix schenckii (strain ATCC 58251 / de Perez 2211183) TaxID=1391915 RepID=U7PLT6_SPOS1|nr:hypothetical protein HMPREF1624_07976 [Sporothrix schenckii ATCC 58251]
MAFHWSAPSRAIAVAPVLTQSISMAAADNNFPQYVNISIIFPRNETYDSTSGILTVIFSLTNKANAINLYPEMSVNISRSSGEENNTQVQTELFLDNPQQLSPNSIGHITTSGDNVYLYTALPAMLGYEGTFHVDYSISLAAMVASNDTRGFVSAVDTPASYGSFGFTLKRGAGASLADLVTGTANTSCANVPFAWPVSVVGIEDEGCKLHVNSVPGVTCAYLDSTTLGIVADYDEDKPFVNMTTTTFGCAPTMDAAAATTVVSGIWNASCIHSGNISCPASNLATISAPSLAAAMAVVLGAMAGAMLY